MIEIIGSELNQWDDKRVVKVTNSVATHVHLANQGDSVAVVMELAESQALIPNYLLCTGKQLCVYAVKDGVTIERKIFSVRKRERPEEYVYDGDQRNYIYELITNAHTATEAANQSAQNANDAADKANQAAKSWVIMGEIKGESVVIDDAIDQTFAGFRIFGRTTQDGTPTPEAPVDLVSVENPTIAVNEQTMLVPYTLRGIPVSSGGNYTDANGQQWICDEVDFARGVYVKRTKLFDAFVNSGVFTNTERYSHTTDTALKGRTNKAAICTVIGRSLYGYNTDDKVHFYVDNYTVSVFVPVGFDNSGGKIKVLAALAEDEIIPLADEMLTAFATLHTSRYGTTVSNDQDAYMDIHYVMDAKKYIDSVVGTGGSSAGLVEATVE